MNLQEHDGELALFAVFSDRMCELARAQLVRAVYTRVAELTFMCPPCLLYESMGDVAGFLGQRLQAALLYQILHDNILSC